ncbi:hypothetical protein, partial [Methylophaga sp. SB9B]|uniref:hypothetical protein n=1 Tax=Methylophaga sp. SB9B TaxID=2570356 RepID=UPI001FFF9BA4
ILHHGAQRLQTITCNVSGRDLRSFFNELQQRVHQEVQFDADTILSLLVRLWRKRNHVRIC